MDSVQFYWQLPWLVFFHFAVCFLHITAPCKTHNGAVSVKPRCCGSITQTSEVLCSRTAQLPSERPHLMPAQSLLKSTNLHEYSSAQTSRWPCAVTHIKDGHRSDVWWKQTVWLGTCWSYNTFITSRWCLATRKCIEHIGLLLHLLTDQQCHSWYLTNPCSVCSCFAFPKTPTNSHFHTFPQHFNCFSSTLVHSSRDFPAHTQKIQFMQSSELHLISYNDFQGKGGSKRDAVSEGMFHLQISVSSITRLLCWWQTLKSLFYQI